jgi:hypothetical protein
MRQGITFQLGALETAHHGASGRKTLGKSGWGWGWTLWLWLEKVISNWGFQKRIFSNNQLWNDVLTGFFKHSNARF